MKEIIDHRVYELLKNKYERVDLDYVLFRFDDEYVGIETHKEAINEAFRILNKRYDLNIYIDFKKMIGLKIEIDELLEIPDYYIKSTGNRNYSIPNPLPYWFAFLEPPYGNSYDRFDFIEFNNCLFHNENVEVYRWNDDFSNYFDAGKEWWGTGLWTAFDVENKLFVIIGASLTD